LRSYRVFGDVDVLLLAELDQLGLEETGVALDLVDGRCDTSTVNEGLEVLLGVVGDTDRAGLLLGQLCHGLPCVDDGNVVEHLDVVALEREKVVVGVGLLVESDGEVDEVKVEVVEAELSQAVVESGGDILGAVLGVPQLGCDEDVLALESRNLTAESLLEGLSDLLLVAVDLGKIKVTVASLESLKDGSANLTRLGLPCTKTQLTENGVLAMRIAGHWIGLGCLGTHGMVLPLLRVTFLPRDMIADLMDVYKIGELVSEVEEKEKRICFYIELGN
jgi:hypothetical protein